MARRMGSTSSPSSQASTGMLALRASWHARPWVSCSHRKIIARERLRAFANSL